MEREKERREERSRFCQSPAELLLLYLLTDCTWSETLFVSYSICRRDGCRNNDDGDGRRLLRHSPSIVLLSAWSRPSGHTHTEREKENNRPESFENMQNQIIFSFSFSLSRRARTFWVKCSANAYRSIGSLSSRCCCCWKRNTFFYFRGDQNWDRVLAPIPANMVIRKKETTFLDETVKATRTNKHRQNRTISNNREQCQLGRISFWLVRFPVDRLDTTKEQTVSASKYDNSN